MTKKTDNLISINEEWVTEALKIITEELEIRELDVEQKSSLQRIVVLSVALYLMHARESIVSTTKNPQ